VVSAPWPGAGHSPCHARSGGLARTKQHSATHQERAKPAPRERATLHGVDVSLRSMCQLEARTAERPDLDSPL
jgi:hypothetical protein